MISVELSGIKIIGSSNTNSHSILDQIRHIVKSISSWNKNSLHYYSNHYRFNICFIKVVKNNIEDFRVNHVQYNHKVCCLVP